MTFATPIALGMLAPWAGVVAYLLLGLKKSASVPFVNLWRSEVARPPIRRSLQRLPRWVALMLIAAAVAIFAAAGPRLLLQSSDSSLTANATATIGIRFAAVRSNQVMVTVRNDAAASRAALTVETDQSRSTNSIELPSLGESRNYFFDLPTGVTRVHVTLAATDAIRAGEPVELLRRRTWPTVRASTPLPAEVSRIIDVYSHHRPPSDGSVIVTFATGDAAAAGDSPAVILAHGSSPITGPPDVTPHSITADIDWTTAVAGATLAAAPPPGWTPVVSIAGRPVVAVHDQPARQVWIGFDSPAFPRSPAFVVFWTNVLDWAGQGVDAFQPLQGTVFASDSPKTAEIAVPPAYDCSPWLACAAISLSGFAAWSVPKPFA